MASKRRQQCKDSPGAVAAAVVDHIVPPGEHFWVSRCVRVDVHQEPAVVSSLSDQILNEMLEMKHKLNATRV
jgi:hypothetical protein